LCDRYFLSTAAYQGAAGFDPETILARNSFAPVPDIALLFHVPVEVGTDRIIKGRGDTPNDFEQQDTLKKVADIFASIQRSYIKRIDASGSIEKVHQDVLKHISPLLLTHSSPVPE
jgi:dTMP kinase